MQNLPRLADFYVDEIAPAASKLTRAEFEQRLSAADVPHGVVHRLGEVHEDPQVVHNQTFVEHEHPRAGRLREPRHAARFLGTPLEPPAPAPALGEHGDELLRELGFGGRIAELRAAGVLG
jgi:crotonobetainyl-CoA:carnitine CoA-transferase CaiB-like acyl-CoA transferase